MGWPQNSKSSQFTASGFFFDPPNFAKIYITWAVAKKKNGWHLTPSQSKPSFPGCWPSTSPAGEKIEIWRKLENFDQILKGKQFFPTNAKKIYIKNRNYPQVSGWKQKIDLKPTVP